MTRRSPQRPKSVPTPKAPQNQPAESEDLGIDEVLAEYEAQIGALTGQLIQKNIAIKKLVAERNSLKKELLKKNGMESDDPPSEEGSADS